MASPDRPRIGYVVKRYPRYSETFIVNEILAHEASGLAIDVFSLRPPVDTHFQDAIARVRAPVTYLPDGYKASSLWEMFQAASEQLPGFWEALDGVHAFGAEASDVHKALALAIEVRARGIGHLHAHFGSSPTTVAAIAARIVRIPFSFTAHAKDIYHESVQPAELGRKLAEARTVITVSDYNLSHLRRTYGPAAARVQRIYNGLDLERFPFASPGIRSPRIVAIGRLVEKKGFAGLISACAILRDKGVQFRCQIVGGGPLEQDLADQVERLDLSDRVQLLGPRPQCELIQLIQRAAFFVAPSVEGSDGNRDGLPTVLLEAMALGTPCVSTPITGIPEVVRDSSTGLLVPQGNPPALSQAMLRLLDDPSLRVSLAARARDLIEAEFDIRRNISQVQEIFGAASAVPATAG